MWRIGLPVRDILHAATFRACFCNNRLRQPISYGNGLLRQQNMVFSKLNILCRVARMRKITSYLMFGQKNICGQLNLLASCSEVVDVVWWTKCDKEVRITALTKKKLRLQIAGMVGSVYALTRLAPATSSCCKQLPQIKLRSELWILDLRFDIVPLLSPTLW